MSIRNLTKVPKLSLVYFSDDQSACIVETKKLRRKDTGESYTEWMQLLSEVGANNWRHWLLLQMVGP